jgi:hypothetical protein
VTRRDFLRVGTLTFLGVHLSQFLEARRLYASDGDAEKAKAKACIMVWLDGGPPQMDTFDPKPTSSFKAIGTNVPGIQLSELLPRLSKQADKFSIVRSVHTEENNHGGATHYAATGHQPNPAMKFPGIGAIITKEMGPRDNVPPHVIVPGLPKGKIYDDFFRGHFIGPEHDPLVLPDPSKPGFAVPDLSLPKSLSVKSLEDRRSFLNVVDRFYREKVESAQFSSMDTFVEQAWNMILSPAVREAFDLAKETDKTKDAYGRDGFGQSMLLARRLVEAGSRFVTASGYGAQAWDTHGGNDPAMRDRLGPTFDRTFSALLEDLEQRGLLESTVVVVSGEFGRTAHLNPQFGRDHWPECWSMVLAGGGIQGGRVVGASDERGAYVADRMVSMGDIFATIYKAFGIDWNKEYMHPIGRPVKIANAINDETGRPLGDLF